MIKYLLLITFLLSYTLFHWASSQKLQERLSQGLCSHQISCFYCCCCCCCFVFFALCGVVLSLISDYSFFVSTGISKTLIIASYLYLETVMVNCDKCILQCVTSIYDQLCLTIRKICLKIKMHSIAGDG